MPTPAGRMPSPGASAPHRLATTRLFRQHTYSLFAVLSMAERMHLLWLLAGKERDVASLAAVTGDGVGMVRHHLGKLRLAGKVCANRQRRRQVHTATNLHVLTMIRLAMSNRRQPREVLSADEHLPVPAPQRNATTGMATRR